MARLTAIQPQVATGKAKELLVAVQAKLKITPNMTSVMANSPAVLQAYLSFSGAMGQGALDAKVREEIALEVGEQNSCQYCVSAHAAVGKMIGLSDSEIQQAREARSASRGMPPHFNSRANWLQKGDALRTRTWRLCGAQASRMVKSPRSSRTWR
jgi:AhpD family alkylhydroperoxidase